MSEASESYDDLKRTKRIHNVSLSFAHIKWKAVNQCASRPIVTKITPQFSGTLNLHLEKCSLLNITQLFDM